MMGAMRSIWQDASVVKQKVRPGTAKRMLRFAQPYSWLLALFLLVVIVDAVAGIVNPLIFRDIITDLTEALRAAQILPLIESLPKGLDTLVGERSYRFSGGEKQRLAIARLLLKAPDIVILDEATAHLDSESEAAIQRAFEIALRGRTSIVIAHRLSTILKADQILVVQDGRIVERGAHSELVENTGLYADLYRRQFADVV